MAAALTLTLASFAANPSNGTLSTSNPTLTYTAGPNLVSNPTGTVELDCSTLPCDEYALTVDVPAAYEDTHQIRIHISWTSPVEDYDLNVSNVGSSGNTPGVPETVIAPAKSGSYTVQVVPYAVHGGTFTGTITLEEKPAPPAGGGGTVGTGGNGPRFETYNPPAGSGLGQSAGEPSVGFGKPSAQYPGGRYMFVASLQTLRVSFDDCASPAKANWEDVTAPTTGIVTLDPILESDKDGYGRTFVSQLGPKTSFLAFTDNDGGKDGNAIGDWTPSQGAPINPGVDHQTIGVGPFVPGLLGSTNGYPSAVYYASQDIGIAQLGISRDGGLTFGPAIPMYNLTQCGGLHGHVTVGPDGTVYVPNKGCTPGATGVEGGGAQGFAISEDEGTTFAVRTVPGTARGNNDPSVGVGRGDKVKTAAGGPAGRVYFGYSEDGRPKIATSDDKGRTWSTPVDVGTPFGIRNIVFPQVIAGDDDRAAFMFLGTPTGGNYQDTANFTGEWHMYMATTYDGGRTWTTVDTTPNDAVQRGSICTSGTTCGADRNLLDFNDLKMDYEGRIVGAYADGCVGCTSPGTSRSDLATIVRQSGGKRLLAQFDPVEVAVPLAPRVNSVTRSGDTVSLNWSAPDNGGSPITGYNVYRKEGASGVEGRIGTTTKTIFDDTTASAAKQYFYRVTATNAQGESASCGSFPVGDAPVTQSPCTTPGVTVLSDPSGDNTTGAAQRDIRSVSFAELFDPASARNKLYITMKAGSFAPLGTPPPSSRWTVYFTRPNANGTTTEWFVSMVTDDTANPGTPVYRYGHTEPGTGGVRSLVTDGRADRGTFTADGTIIIEISNPTKTSTAATSRVFPELQAGEVIGNINAATQQSAGVLLINDDSTGTGTYTLKGNNFCRPNSAPVASLSASPSSGNAPLAVTLDASGSSDEDTAAPADTIASYTFDFGDGSAPVTVSSPTVTHTYGAGNYRATVRVTDSRGKQSTNSAGVNIEVADPPPPPASLSITTVPEGTSFDLGKIYSTQVTVSNAGTASASGVTVSYPLPAGLAFNAATTTQGACAFAAATSTVNCQLGTVGANSSAGVAIKVKSRQEGTYAPTASYTATGGATGSATSAAVTVIKYADLRVTKVDSVDPITVGDQTTYTMVVKNFGTINAASGVVLTDNLPSGMVFVSATTTQGSLVTPAVNSGGIVTANLGALALNASATVTVTVKATQAGTLVNTATASGNETDPTTSNNTATQTTTVNASAPQATLQKVLLSSYSPVGGCQPYPTGQVYLTAAAPAGGVTVNLSSTSAGATVPSSIFIAAGQTRSDPFTVTTVPVAKRSDGNIVATLGSASVVRIIQVYGGSCPQ